MVPYHTQVGSPDATHLAFLLHGVLGAGHNLRSLAKRLSDARPDYRFVLIDLRGHGRSLGAAPPHSIASCVDDLFELRAELGRAPEVVLGHSLGGKVALEYARRVSILSQGTQGPTRDPLLQVWTLDSDPGAQVPDEAHQVNVVLACLLAHPGPFVSRAAAISALTEAGLSSGLANWLATNLDRKDGQFVFRLELANIQELLKDYFTLDLWPFLETEASRMGIRFDLLLAEHSDRFTEHMKERTLSLEKQEGFQVHILPKSGHWVHVDNPEGLINIVVQNLTPIP